MFVLSLNIRAAGSRLFHDHSCDPSPLKRREEGKACWNASIINNRDIISVGGGRIIWRELVESPAEGTEWMCATFFSLMEHITFLHHSDDDPPHHPFLKFCFVLRRWRRQDDDDEKDILRYLGKDDDDPSPDTKSFVTRVWQLHDSRDDGDLKDSTEDKILLPRISFL